jgi:hypothetical protein
MRLKSLFLYPFFLSATALLSAPAIAGMTEAQAALSRADAKIEIVARHSSQPGMQNDQSFNRSHQKLAAARDAMKANKYDTAEMLAEEAALLAELTAEVAKLAVLQTSRNDITKAAIISN